MSGIITPNPRSRYGRILPGIALTATVGVFFSACSPDAESSQDAASDTASQSASAPTGNADATQGAAIEGALTDSMTAFGLRSLIVRITEDGEDVYTSAMGESMTGVPATPNMHFRNGSFAFTYIGQTFAKLVDDGKVALDDPLSNWFPEYPRADQIAIRNLLNMTSGYADYVYLSLSRWAGPT